MKRWALFGWDRYYPSGGVNDLIGVFATREEAEAHATHNIDIENYEIVDLQQLMEGEE